MEDPYLDFVRDLQSLDKDELVALFSEYWVELKHNAENDISNKDGYMVSEFGKIKMTQVNLIRNLVKLKSENKK